MVVVVLCGGSRCRGRHAVAEWTDDGLADWLVVLGNRV